VNVQRTLAVLAAALFVGAVALATVGSEMVSLGVAVSWLSPGGVETLHNWLVRNMGPWWWINIAHPLLIRPAWLPLGSLGLIFAGAAASVPARDATRRSHRRS
jgi:hypothetical protein